MNITTKRPGVVTLITVLAVTAVAMTAFLTLTTLTSNQLRQVTSTGISEQAYYAAEGGINDGLHRLSLNPGAQTYTITINNVPTNVNIRIDSSDPLGKRRIIESSVDYQGTQRKLQVTANTNALASNIQYAVQSGNGGIEIDNGGQIIGSLYANGAIVGQNQNQVTVHGETWSTTSITRAQIGTVASPQNAHAPLYTQVTVTGTRYTETPPVTPYPFTQQQIDTYKDLADNTITPGNVTVGNGATVSLPAQKITGNLVIGNNATVNLEGPVWVVGEVQTSPGFTLRLPATAGEASGVLLTDRAIEIRNGATLMGSGNIKSYLLIISLRDEIANLSTPVIFGENNSTSVIYFAPNGLIRVNNNAQLNNTTGYKIHLRPQSTVSYDPNLSGFFIPAGPPQPISPLPGTWKEL